MAAIRNKDETEQITEPSPSNCAIPICSQGMDSDSHSEHSGAASSNKPSASNRPSPADLSRSNVILPSNTRDSSRMTKCIDGIKTSPRALDFKDKRERGPAFCLFRGHDHSQRLIEEFDGLRNLQGEEPLTLRIMTFGVEPLHPWHNNSASSSQ